MSPRLHRPLTALLVSLSLAVLSACSSVRGWARGGSGQPARAGAAVTIPLGK